MYAQRFYTIRYTVPGDDSVRQQTKAWYDPHAFKARFVKVNPGAIVEGVYDQATDIKVI
jgi:hypothetical protein